MTIAILNKQEKVKAWARDILISFLASVLVGAFAPIAIQLPFLPAPFTLQNNIILFLAATMGSRRGALTVISFLVQGALGFPVFAAGKFGLAHLFGPRGGYLLGYLVAAFVVGKLVERTRDKTPLRIFQIMWLGFIIIYFLGACYLSHFIGMKSAIIAGVLPFIITDAIKTIFFARLYFNRVASNE